MSFVNKELLDVIEDIIERKTLYLRHYEGEVVSIKDTSEIQQDGSVRVKIDTLGFDSEDKAVWVYPRFVNSMITPKVGDILDIGFMDGDKSKPVYYGRVIERSNQLPNSYDGKETNQVIFEDPDGMSIVYDNKGKKYTVTISQKKIAEYTGSKITLLEGLKSAASYPQIALSVNELKNDLTTLKAVFSGWVPAPNDGGAALKTASGAWFGTPLTEDITAAEVSDIKVT